MFDTVYFTNLQKKLGLLSTDQALFSDERTSFLDLVANQPKHRHHQNIATTGATDLIPEPYNGGDCGGGTGGV
ncbi:hypothetical protein SDJN02_27249, partial [Cucurbita argyrosperma subsp. argyrosperma]